METIKFKKPHRAHEVFIAILAVAMIGLCIVFVFLPRSTYSELEKRDLAKFPDPSDYTGSPSEYTSQISHWFSDSEPFRDRFMAMSMTLRDIIRVSFGSDEEAVTFRPSETPSPQTVTAAADQEAKENPLANENAKVADAGIIIIGKGDHVRALMAFGGRGELTNTYIKLCTEYAKAFPNVQVYSMVAPSSTEFYLPDKAKKCSSPQLPVLEYIRSHLPSNVKFVDVYSALAPHIDEDIYLRTDHHWAPLGGYYAAGALAKTAGVPFKDLSNYDKRTVHRVVGSMYGYSKDISVKNSPEDFTYFIPKGLNYETYFTTYKIDEDYHITSQSGPYKGQFFHHFKDGAGGAYLTFMGGDQHLVKIKTGTTSNRKLLIVKDSYGNAVPSNLFYSFSEIHVVDFRYFKENMKAYVRDNGITDLVLFFNIFNVCGSSASNKVLKFLTQPAGDFSQESRHKASENTDHEAEPDADAHKKHTPEVSTSPATNTPVETPPEETPEKSELILEF